MAIPGVALPMLIAGGKAIGAWDPAKKGSLITLSSGNHAATLSASDNVLVASKTGVTAGKVYAEIKVTNNNHTGARLGIGLSSVSWSSNAYSLGSDSSSVGYQAWAAGGGAGQYWFNGSGTTSGGPTLATDDIFQIAFDRGAGKLWFGVNNTWVNNAAGGNPSTGSNPLISSGLGSGTWYVAAYGNFDNGVLTINCGDSAFAYTLPTGFSAWG